MSSIKDRGPTLPLAPPQPETSTTVRRPQDGRVPESMPPEVATPSRRASAAEMERLASSSLSRSGKRRRGAHEVDDLGPQALTLPLDEDMEEAAGEDRQPVLAEVQDAMSLQQSLLRECIESGALAGPAEGMIGRMVGYLLQSQPEVAARLQATLDAGPAASPPLLVEAGALLGPVRQSLEAYRGGALGPMDAVQALLSATCVVAGRPEALPVGAAAVDAARLLEASQKVVAEGQGAVQSARDLNNGVSQKVMMQRTHIFKR